MAYEQRQVEDGILAYRALRSGVAPRTGKWWPVRSPG